MIRMRLVGWNVQPVVMADDGVNLTPVTVSAQMIPAANWESFKGGGDAEALESVRTQIEGGLDEEHTKASSEPVDQP
jgi:hypothetical protein